MLPWYVQVDLFFYREPEEAKEQEEEEVIAAPDYGATDYSATALGLQADQWTTQIPDGQWGAEIVAPPAIPAVAGVDWAPAPGESLSLSLSPVCVCLSPG